jgi:hypothetical protein
MRFYAGLEPAFAGLNAGVISPAQGLSAVEVTSPATRDCGAPPPWGLRDSQVAPIFLGSSAVIEEFRFSNYFSVSLESIVEKCKVSIAFATSLGSDEICRLSW